MIRRLSFALVTGSMLAATLPGAASAQGSGWTAELVPTDSLAAPAPFGPGEHLVYGVKLGWFNVGQGHLTVEGLDWVRGNQTYRFVMGMQGGRLGFSINDRYTSWTDLHAFQSWRFIREYGGTYTSRRHYEFYPDRDMWDREDNDEFGPMPTDAPLDDIAFVYFLRTLPLQVGDHYSFDRYFKVEGNPVTVDVVRKDRRKTDAGTFNTIVVRPSFQSEGLFSEDGEAELHFTDDDRRILVYMKVDLPRFPGGISLHLRSIQEGFPVNPESRAAVLSAREARGQSGRPNR
ncbi:MAG: DUF3108 domain-containing protein [Gemmatimonadetes bacterium]|nr:DUF3108 domain-containing protein [Gemmatimonadota bacterium]